MKDEIICPKCKGTSFKLISSAVSENELFIWCENCENFAEENVVIKFPIHKKYVGLYLFD